MYGKFFFYFLKGETKVARDMTKGSIGRSIAGFTLPMFITLMSQTLFSTVDSMMLGNFVGATALGSVASCSSIINLFLLFSNGYAVGYKVTIGQFYGAGRYRHVREGIYTSLFSMAGMSLIITTLGSLFTVPLLRFMNTVPELLPNATTYLRLYFLGITLIIFRGGINNIFYGLGDTKTPMIFQTAQMLLHIGFDYLLLEVADLGVMGVALAGWCSRSLTLIPLITILFVRMRSFPPTKKYFRFTLFKKITSLALPACLANIMSTLGMVLVNRLINSFGTQVVTGNNIASNVNNFCFIFTNAFGSCAGAFASQNFGAKHMQRIKKCGTICFGINIIYSIGLLILFRFCGSSIADLFLGSDTDPALYDSIKQYAASYLNVVSIFYFVYGAGHVCNEILRSVGKIKITVIAMLLQLSVRISLTYALSPIIGQAAVYWGIVACWLSSYVFTTVYFFSGRWLPHYRAAHHLKGTTPSKLPTQS